ncbi:MAG: hypothetical protein ACKV0T_03395 [Planctomycetales bacterium]
MSLMRSPSSNMASDMAGGDFSAARIPLNQSAIRIATTSAGVERKNASRFMRATERWLRKRSLPALGEQWLGIDPSSWGVHSVMIKGERLSQTLVWRNSLQLPELLSRDNDPFLPRNESIH